MLWNHGYLAAQGFQQLCSCSISTISNSLCLHQVT
jgi:hypothetical protein